MRLMILFLKPMSALLLVSLLGVGCGGGQCDEPNPEYDPTVPGSKPCLDPTPSVSGTVEADDATNSSSNGDQGGSTNVDGTVNRQLDRSTGDEDLSTADINASRGEEDVEEVDVWAGYEDVEQGSFNDAVEEFDVWAGYEDVEQGSFDDAVEEFDVWAGYEDVAEDITEETDVWEGDVTDEEDVAISEGCMISGSPGCGGCGCEDCVCTADPYCCGTSWDSLCVEQCTNDCDGCGGNIEGEAEDTWEEDTWEGDAWVEGNG